MNRKKRGGKGRHRVELQDFHAVSLGCPEEVLAVDETLKKLAALDPFHAQILELRLFKGLDVKEIAEVVGLSPRTIERHWVMIRAWTLHELSRDGGGS